MVMMPHLPKANARRSARPFWRTRTLRYGLTLASAVAGVLLFLLASASSNTPLFERHYPLLLALNATSAAALLVIVLVLVVRLTRRYRAGQFGTRMMARFAISFGLMGVVPGALIYIVSVQVLGKSIESWFNVRVESALEAGLALGRSTLDAMLADLNAKARVVAFGLSELPELQQASNLNRLREQTGVEQALLLTSSGRVLAAAGSGVDNTALIPEMPSSAVMRQIRVARLYSAVESPLAESDTGLASASSASSSAPNVSSHDEPRGLRLRVVIPVPSSNFVLRSDSVYVQLLQSVPAALAANAEAVQNGMRDYQELSLSRTGLQKTYTVTLTLTLLLSMCAALAVSFLLASWLTAPLLLLAEGTKAVAGGDYRPMQAIETNDELGTLTQSFNAMTRQLDDARAAVEKNRAALQNANTYLESILANLSAGVLVFDEAFRLVTANDGAARILRVSLTDKLGARLDGHGTSGSDAPHTGHPIALAAFAETIAAAFSDPAGAGTDWQKQIELTAPLSPAALAASDGEAAEPVVVLARGSRCPVGSGADLREGYLVVFDDVTDVIAAQRSIAWGEVARRLAHEIKNPLTPIQLSAERLKMKLAGGLAARDAEVLERSVTTIVNQVAAMRRMVDDFRDYAKSPSVSMSALDLNSLIAEVMTLYDVHHETDAAEEARSDAALPTLVLASDLPLIIGDATRLRQVIHNLVLNAQDATHDRAAPQIVVSTEALAPRTGTGTGRAAAGAPAHEPMVRLTVSDNGSGFPARILARAFEPYVTTKSRGTGLGLAVVKKIADEHQARIDLKNREEGGASVSIIFTRVAGRQLRVA